MKGFGFVQFHSIGEAQAALSMNAKQLLGEIPANA
jgi:RNA recognition motif-containing protein